MIQSTVYVVLIWRMDAGGRLKARRPCGFATAQQAVARARSAVRRGNVAVASKRTIDTETDEIVEHLEIFRGGRLLENFVAI
ncbi:hypothetical protein [Chenggangzhangella methanolivorans]|uniref:Uncharacterized protein n=1 Tax=Chenggangzhangella methanolivorans TaxID=1437009 RepID=A0A9E6RA11_9HYPH|nr:hypothetical protein [Chenggangzhangella methanolivorans]QZN99558.1 hypothetical protein K6K41_23080 [Chenggangzhangella methanolivorans]